MKKTYISIISLSLLILSSDSLYALDASYAVERDSDVHITMPKVPEATKVKAVVVTPVNIIVDGKKQPIAPVEQEVNKRNSIGFGERVPPNYKL